MYWRCIKKSVKKGQNVNRQFVCFLCKIKLYLTCEHICYMFTNDYVLRENTAPYVLSTKFFLILHWNKQISCIYLFLILFHFVIMFLLPSKCGKSCWLGITHKSLLSVNLFPLMEAELKLNYFMGLYLINLLTETCWFYLTVFLWLI